MTILLILLFFFSIHVFSQIEPPDSVSTSNNIRCTSCQTLLEKSITYITQYGLESFRDFLITRYCERLPSESFMICKQAVENQTVRLQQWIEDRIEPQEICQKLVCVRKKKKGYKNRYYKNYETVNKYNQL